MLVCSVKISQAKPEIFFFEVFFCYPFCFCDMIKQKRKGIEKD